MPIRSSQVEGSGLVLVLAMAGIGIGIIGWGLVGGAETQQIDTGWVSCTVPSGQSSCNLHSIFHKAFVKPPNVSFTFANDPFGPSTGFVIPHSIDIISAGGLTDTWTTMPNAQTEIFGNTKNRFFFGSIPNDIYSTALFFTVNVAIAGSANSMLEVQLTNDDTNWFDVANPSGSCDISISTVGLQVASCALVSSATLSTYFHGRIVGFGGNGIASPSFGFVAVEFQSQFLSPSQLSTLQVSNTNFNISLISPFPPTTDSLVTVSWIAIGCVKGTKTC